jgi:hypothetical protein
MKIIGFNISRVKKTPDKMEAISASDIDQAYLGGDPYSSLLTSIPTFKRSVIYDDVDFIDSYDEEVSKYLTDLANDATQYSTQTNSTIWVTSKDDAVKLELNKMLSRLSMDDISPNIVRSMAKYGDKFARVVIDPELGIKSLKTNYHPKQVVRLEDGGVLVGFHIEYEESPLERYEMIHWMLPSEYVEDDIIIDRFDLFEKYFIDKNPQYGFTDVFRIIQTSKRLKFVEDALILGRLAGSKLYRTHMVEVGAATATDRVNIMKRYVKNWAKASSNNYLDSKAYSEANKFSYEEDRYFPVNDGIGTSTVTEYGGNMDITGISDIEYMQKKRNRILGIPEDSQMMNRLQQDTKYARKVASTQRAYLKGVYQLCDIQLDTKSAYTPKRRYSLNMVDVDAFVQSERYDLLSASIDFCERVMSISQIEGIQINTGYLFKYLINNYIKFPNLEIEKLFEPDVDSAGVPPIPGLHSKSGSGSTDSDIEQSALQVGDNPKAVSSMLAQLEDLISKDKVTKESLTRLDSVVQEHIRRTNEPAQESDVKSNNQSVRTR